MAAAAPRQLDEGVKDTLARRRWRGFVAVTPDSHHAIDHHEAQQPSDGTDGPFGQSDAKSLTQSDPNERDH